MKSKYVNYLHISLFCWEKIVHHHFCPQPPIPTMTKILFPEIHIILLDWSQLLLNSLNKER